MNLPEDLLRQLAAIADDVGRIEAPTDIRRQLVALCRTARIALGAGSVSIARLDHETLVYEAAEGTGGDAIVGLRLPLTRGIASYVVRTGQSLIVEQVAQDPRFARDIAERVGYVPTSMLVTPITDDRGQSIGAVSVLDRAGDGADALAIASSVADQAALVLPQVGLVARLAPVLFAAVAEVAAEQELATALRKQSIETPDATVELAALVAELHALGPDARAAAVRIVSELTAMAAPPRRRR